MGVPPVTSATGPSACDCRLRQDYGCNAPGPVATGGKSAPTRSLPCGTQGGSNCRRGSVSGSRSQHPRSASANDDISAWVLPLADREVFGIPCAISCHRGHFNTGEQIMKPIVRAVPFLVSVFAI